jgi:hypothetical protein
METRLFTGRASPHASRRVSVVALRLPATVLPRKTRATVLPFWIGWGRAIGVGRSDRAATIG